MLDPRAGRMYNTFHARYWFLRWPLDHVFVSDAFLLRGLKRLPAFGSDHFPIFIAVERAPAAAAVQKRPNQTPTTTPRRATSCSAPAAAEAGRPAQAAVD